MRTASLECQGLDKTPSLPLYVSFDIFNKNSNEDDDDSIARKQRLAEAALISLAIEACDADA
jgi:hypothetical protein